MVKPATQEEILKEVIKDKLPKWLKTHFPNDEEWWYVQNAIGDLVGWERWYAGFIFKLDKKRKKR